MNRFKFGAFALVGNPKSLFLAGALLVGLSLSHGTLQAQPISVPNYSFESQSGFGQPFGVNIFVDSWQKAERPGYFDEGAFGFLWIQTAGVFQNTPAGSPNPYTNAVGVQAGYILPFPGVQLFQDYNTMDWNDASPTHDFDATFEVGKSYNLTVGLNGKDITENDIFQISLYYVDDLDQKVTVAATPIYFSSALFPNSTPRGLTDFTVNTSVVQASDDWAGRHIGIMLESVYGNGVGNWDFDNVQLSAVPEPGSLALLAVGAGAAWLARRRMRA